MRRDCGYAGCMGVADQRIYGVSPHMRRSGQRKGPDVELDVADDEHDAVGSMRGDVALTQGG